MHAICFLDVEQVQHLEVADPRIEQPTDALVAVEMAGLCGSDLHVYHGRERGLDPQTVMGHEFVGRIVDVGSDVRRFEIGHRVCGAFSTSCGGCFYCRRGLTSRCSSGELFGWRRLGVGLHGCQATLVRVPWAETTMIRVEDSIADRAAILLGDNLSTAFFARIWPVSSPAVFTWLSVAVPSDCCPFWPHIKKVPPTFSPSIRLPTG